MIEEAALELFLEQGYAHTAVDDIARRAGVSRATLFNYFAAKSDLLWLDLDLMLDGLERQIDDGKQLGEALAAVSTGVRSIPLAVIQAESIGADGELAASAAVRMLRFVALVRRALPRAEELPRRPSVEVRAAAVAGAVAAAWIDWARAGASRGALDSAIFEALEGLDLGVARASGR